MPPMVYAILSALGALLRIPGQARVVRLPPHCLTKNVTQTRRCLSRNVTDDQVGRPWRPPSAAGVIRCRNDPHHGGTGRQRCVWQVIALQWAQETPRNGPVTWPMRHPVTKLREATRGEWQFPIRLSPFVSGETQTAQRPIAIDAKISFGRPIVLKAGVSTITIAERIDAGCVNGSSLPTATSVHGSPKSSPQPVY